MTRVVSGVDSSRMIEVHGASTTWVAGTGPDMPGRCRRSVSVSEAQRDFPVADSIRVPVVKYVMVEPGWSVARSRLTRDSGASGSG
jgi:hypothetical protein